MKNLVLRCVFFAGAAAVMVVAGAFLSGCGQRENPADPQFAEFRLPDTYSYEFTSLDSTSLQDGELGRTIYVYTPPGYIKGDPGQNRPYPVLYLLHDFGGDHNQFETYNLSTLADDLIAKGEIKPMLIVTANASNMFGLLMYADGSLGGDYESMIVPELIGRAITAGKYKLHTEAGLNGREARAIGGLGFGGQAAVKLAIKHPEFFSSVSAMNAPLAFAGDGGTTTEGFQGLFKYYFVENGITPGDYEVYKNIPHGATDGRLTPVTDMLIAMSAAFSPTPDPNFLRPWSLHDTVPGFNDVVYFDLPFDHQLYTEGPVWARWMEHDARTLLANNPDALNDVAVYIDAAQEDQYGFHLQAALFAQDIENLGTVTDFEYHTYSGSPDLPADHGRLISARLAQMLKFHSDRFAQPAGW